MSANGWVHAVRLGRMVEDGVAPSIFGLIERGDRARAEPGRQMRGRVVFRFAEDFSPLRITFRREVVVLEDGDSRGPDLLIEGRLPDIVHFATVPTLRGAPTRRPDRASHAAARLLMRLAVGRVRIEARTECSAALCSCPDGF